MAKTYQRARGSASCAARNSAKEHLSAPQARGGLIATAILARERPTPAGALQRGPAALNTRRPSNDRPSPGQARPASAGAARGDQSGRRDLVGQLAADLPELEGRDPGQGARRRARRVGSAAD